MPQLTLYLGGADFCHPVSGNEGHGQQHYHFPTAQSGIFPTLGLDPQVLPGPSLSLTPYVLLVTTAGLPTSPIHSDAAYSSTHSPIVTATPLVQVTGWL